MELEPVEIDRYAVHVRPNLKVLSARRCAIQTNTATKTATALAGGSCVFCLSSTGVIGPIPERETDAAVDDHLT